MSVVVAIPFRHQAGFDRAGQLAQVVARLQTHPALRVVVAAQEPGGVFHRGALLNAAFNATRGTQGHVHSDVADRFICHDCDLVPDDVLLNLYAENTDPFVCFASTGTRYSSSPSFVGGVTGFSRAVFQQLNGYPVRCARGWGGEDDEMRRRATSCGIGITRNTLGRVVDLEDMDLDTKLTWLRAHPGEKNMTKWELRDMHAHTWQTNGLRGLPSREHPFVLSRRVDDTGVTRLRVRVPGPLDPEATSGPPPKLAVQGV